MLVRFKSKPAAEYLLQNGEVYTIRPEAPLRTRRCVIDIDGTRIQAEREGIISFPLSAVQLACNQRHLEAAVEKSGFADLDAWLGEVKRLNRRKGGDAWYTLFRIRLLSQGTKGSG